MIEKEYPTVKLSVGDVIQTERGDRYLVTNVDSLRNNVSKFIPCVAGLSKNGIAREIPISQVTEIIFHEHQFVEFIHNIDKL